VEIYRSQKRSFDERKGKQNNSLSIKLTLPYHILYSFWYKAQAPILTSFFDFNFGKPKDRGAYLLNGQVGFWEKIPVPPLL
jgi:hypothetical protein